MESLVIFNYSNFRSFLQDYVIEKKRSTRNFSLSNMAKKMGLANTASLSRIIKGDREPGNEISERLVQYFEFGPEQTSYFRYLILLEKAKKDAQLKTLLMEKLKELHPDKKFHLLDENVFKVISNWYYLVLREVVHLKNFSEDPYEISKILQIKINPAEVKDALKTLQVLDLLTRAPTGKLVQSKPCVTTTDDIASEASKRNHEQNLDNAKWAVRNIDVGEREFSNVCFTMKKQDLTEAKKMLREFKSKFMEKFEAASGEGEEVYQLQLQFFPYTKSSNLFDLEEEIPEEVQ